MQEVHCATTRLRGTSEGSNPPFPQSASRGRHSSQVKQKDMIGHKEGLFNVCFHIKVKMKKFLLLLMKFLTNFDRKAFVKICVKFSLTRGDRRRTHTSFIYIQNKVSQKNISSTKTCDQSGHILEATGNKMAATESAQPNIWTALCSQTPTDTFFLKLFMLSKRVET